MREIKFRVWDNVDYMSTPFTFQDLMVKDVGFTSDCPVMQFTGLKDKNGVEIYEGDIVRVLYSDWPSNTDYSISLEDYLIKISSVGFVVFNSPNFEINLGVGRYGEENFGGFNVQPHGMIEVIGNIHQNPELLTP